MIFRRRRIRIKMEYATLRLRSEAPNDRSAPADQDRSEAESSGPATDPMSLPRLTDSQKACGHQKVSTAPSVPPAQEPNP